jgi:cell division septation protein DedD
MLRLLCALIFAIPVFAKTPVDLMLEGRFAEARAILDSIQAEPRYALLLDAMTEPNAVRACSLYTVIAQRYPHSDCDSVAQTRLQMAATMGVPISPREDVKNEAESPASTTQSASVSVIEPNPNSAPVTPTVTPATLPPTSVATIKIDKSPPAPVVEKSEPAPVTSTLSNAASAPATPANTVKIDKSPPAPVVEKSEPAPVTPALSTAAIVPATPATALKTEKSPPAPAVQKSEPASVAHVVPKPETLTPHDQPTAHPGAWFVQVGAFGNQENARKLAAKLEQAGYGIALVPKTTNGKELLQVRVGGYPDRDACSAAADELKAKYNLSVALVIQ